MSATLAAVTDPATAGVDLTFTDVTVPIVTITRAVDGFGEMPVRGAELKVTSGGVVFIRDDEAPFRVDIIYTAFDGAGTPIASTTTMLNVDGVWLKAPGMASMSQPVHIADHDREDSYSTPNGVFPVVGSPFPLVVTGMTSARKTSIALYTMDPQEAARLLRLIAATAIVLIETPAGHGFARGYFAVSDVARKQLSRQLGEDASVWTLPLVEVDAPEGGSAGGTTWETVVDTFPTWTALTVGSPSWLSLLQAL